MPYGTRAWDAYGADLWWAGEGKPPEKAATKPGKKPAGNIWVLRHFLAGAWSEELVLPEGEWPWPGKVHVDPKGRAWVLTFRRNPGEDEESARAYLRVAEKSGLRAAWEIPGSQFEFAALGKWQIHSDPQGGVTLLSVVTRENRTFFDAYRTSDLAPQGQEPPAPLHVATRIELPSDGVMRACTDHDHQRVLVGPNSFLWSEDGGQSWKRIPVKLDENLKIHAWICSGPDLHLFGSGPIPGSIKPDPKGLMHVRCNPDGCATSILAHLEPRDLRTFNRGGQPALLAFFSGLEVGVLMEGRPDGRFFVKDVFDPQVPPISGTLWTLDGDPVFHSDTYLRRWEY